MSIYVGLLVALFFFHLFFLENLVNTINRPQERLMFITCDNLAAIFKSLPHMFCGGQDLKYFLRIVFFLILIDFDLRFEGELFQYLS